MATDDPQACKAVAEYWEKVGSGRFERILRLATTVEGWEDIDSDSDDGDEEEAATSMRVQAPLAAQSGDHSMHSAENLNVIRSSARVRDDHFGSMVATRKSWTRTRQSMCIDFGVGCATAFERQGASVCSRRLRSDASVCQTIRAVWELNTWPAWNPLVSSVDSMYFLDDTDRHAFS